MSFAPGIKQPSVSVIAPGGAVWNVPTSPLTVPPVQDTAALARTEKPADAPCSLWLDREKLGVGLPDATSLDVASVHAAPSSAVATSSPVANLERWYAYMVHLLEIGLSEPISEKTPGTVSRTRR